MAAQKKSKKASKKPSKKSKAPAKAMKSGAGNSQLRIRMYRVGFGDFFLMTVPSAAGPQHILIDCGVTGGTTKKGDIGTIKDAVADMAEETGNKLALIIVTHRHQDHIVGFSRSAEIFQKFHGNVDAVWMSAWENEYDPSEKKKKSLAANFQEELTKMAFGMQQHLAASDDKPENAEEIAAMLENATGISQASLAAAGGAGPGKGKGGGSNAASLKFLKEGTGAKPQYYSKGDKPALPPALVKAGLTAEILGPPPTGDTDFMKLMDLKKGVGQYLGDATEGDGNVIDPGFGPQCCGDASQYPASAFREWQRVNEKAPHQALEAAIESAQPTSLFTAAKTLDSFLNNQSLVVLFTFKGKKLLFAGDAQGGNWEYWMFGGTPTKTPSLDKLEPESKEILESLVFYKVGHHGSTNATPMSAVEAMAKSFDAMCSTQFGAFGSVENKSEVPRIPLIDALRDKSTLVRSDEFPVTITGNEVAAVKGAPKTIAKGKKGRFEVGPIYVDYFPG
jgi:beta-lactamase superfamily II metal-dependent hydrolase